MENEISSSEEEPRPTPTKVRRKVLSRKSEKEDDTFITPFIDHPELEILSYEWIGARFKEAWSQEKGLSKIGKSYYSKIIWYGFTISVYFR